MRKRPGVQQKGTDEDSQTDANNIDDDGDTTSLPGGAYPRAAAYGDYGYPVAQGPYPPQFVPYQAPAGPYYPGPAYPGPQAGYGPQYQAGPRYQPVQQQRATETTETIPKTDKKKNKGKKQGKPNF